MSLILTPLQSDNFQRANVNPLAAPWALDEANDFGFQISSDICECNGTNNICEMYFTYAGTPNNQYCSVTLAAAIGTASSFFYLKIRATDNGQSFFSQLGYRFQVTQSGTWNIFLDTASTHASLASGSGLTINPGDVFTFAAVGTSLYVFQNSTQLGSTVVDSTYASGSVQLGGEAVSNLSAVQISNFVMGSAAVASGPTPTSDVPSNAYLGEVTLTGGGSNPSAGQSGVPYIGCVRIVSGPPSRIGTPVFLGNMTLVSAPPSGFANPGPFLGEVSVVASAPAGNPDVQLGQVKQVT